MRVLVTWGSERGGTEGIGRTIAAALGGPGVAVEARPAAEVTDLAGVDAVVVGGALYAFRWHADARRFVDRHARALRRIPTWFFSSGPLDESAERGEIAPVRQVRARMERVGALGHQTFGGRLLPDARGFPAAAMAKKNAGDHRNPGQINAWAKMIADALPTATPGRATAPAGSSPLRLIEHALAAALTCAALLAGLLATTSTGIALIVHAVLTPLIMVASARNYFTPIGARAPVASAGVFAAALAAVEVAVLALAWRQPDHLLGLGWPVALAFATVWATGAIVSMMPERVDRGRPRGTTGTWPPAPATAASPSASGSPPR